MAVLLFFILVNRIWESCHPGLAMGSLMSLQLAFRVKEKSMLTFLFSLSLCLCLVGGFTLTGMNFFKSLMSPNFILFSLLPLGSGHYFKKTLLVCLCFYEGKCLYGKTIHFE